jgi:hypothetical protein
VEAFCFKKKKAQAHRLSQCTGSTSTRGHEGISATIENMLFMLLRRLATSTPMGSAGSVTQSSAPIGFAVVSQSSTERSLSTPTLGTCPWILDSSSSFHMTPYCTYLSSTSPSSRSLTVHTSEGSPLLVVGRGTLSSDSFHVPDVSFVPNLTVQLMSIGQLTDHECRVILDPKFCYFQDRRMGHLVCTGPRRYDSQRLWEHDWLCLPSNVPAGLVGSASVASTSSFA